jgi:hypothetical protein
MGKEVKEAGGHAVAEDATSTCPGPSSPHSPHFWSSAIKTPEFYFRVASLISLCPALGLTGLGQGWIWPL